MSIRVNVRHLQLKDKLVNVQGGEILKYKNHDIWGIIAIKRDSDGHPLRYEIVSLESGTIIAEFEKFEHFIEFCLAYCKEVYDSCDFSVN